MYIAMADNGIDNECNQQAMLPMWRKEKGNQLVVTLPQHRVSQTQRSQLCNQTTREPLKLNEKDNANLMIEG